jgi:hypothetical protein
MLELARRNSGAAIETLAARLHDPDGRVALMAAVSLLERAWGKPTTGPVEEREQGRIDLTALRDDELSLLVKLVAEGRLRTVADAVPATEVDARGEDAVQVVDPPVR